MAEQTITLTEAEREEVRRMAYAGSYSREKADRYVATVERILATRVAGARADELAWVADLIAEVIDAGYIQVRDGGYGHDEGGVWTAVPEGDLRRLEDLLRDQADDLREQGGGR